MDHNDRNIVKDIVQQHTSITLVTPIDTRRKPSHSRSHEYSRSHSMQRSGFKQLHSVSHSHGGSGGLVGNKFTTMNVNDIG